jgi:hypothetical protein
MQYVSLIIFEKGVEKEGAKKKLMKPKPESRK